MFDVSQDLHLTSDLWHLVYYLPDFPRTQKRRGTEFLNTARATLRTRLRPPR
jgi:hypothetical protein